MYSLIAFLNGLLFGAGLVISNMTNPNKILNFLDITGYWDPTLLVVMAAATITTLAGYQIIQRILTKPILSEQFYIPHKSKITFNLVMGSAIFGIGWGIAGYCPGPSITGLATLNWDPFYFVIGMIVGSFIYYFRNKIIRK